MTGLGDAFAGHALISGAALEPDGRRVRCIVEVERLAVLAEPPPAPAPDHGAAVLVVDDSRLVRSALGQILDSAGIGFDTAADGREALAKLSRRSFALVLTDLEMPEMDGYELLERMRADARWRSQPVVVCSSRIDGETPRLRGLDVAGYVAKPFKAEAVLALLRRFLGEPAQALPRSA
jgi:chemosensory pili system protein ChpA (sensor histidine kinase/response regulator)